MEQLRSYQPSLRDQIAWAIAGKAGDWFGAGRHAQQDIAGKVGGLMDFVPGLGEAIGADEAYRDYQDGNYGMAAAGLGLTALGAVPGAGDLMGNAAKGFASKASKLYSDIPDLPQRPFEMDYPHGAPSDATGRLTHDIEGRPLTAPRIAGRTSIGADDVALTPREMRSIGEEITGSPIQFRNGGVGGEDGLAGLYFNESGKPTEIALKRGLTHQQYNEVLPHEVGHAIDLTAGSIPFNEQEAAQNYSRLLRESGSNGQLISPQDIGYSDFEAPYELSAEAIRAYMSNPNYFKSAAPKTAARIREYVNTHPQLKDIIQFNSMAGLGLMGYGMMNEEDQ